MIVLVVGLLLINYLLCGVLVTACYVRWCFCALCHTCRADEPFPLFVLGFIVLWPLVLVGQGVLASMLALETLALWVGGYKR